VSPTDANGSENGAPASWSAAALCRFPLAHPNTLAPSLDSPDRARPSESASRCRAEAALQRAAKAGGLAHSKTSRSPQSTDALMVF